VTGAQVAELLGLEPLPIEGGMWRYTWLDENSGAIYFLMQPDDFSALHRLDGPELWHHYAGAAVNMLLLGPGSDVSRLVLGDDLEAGDRPVVAANAGVWMGAATSGDWSLVGTTMAPPFRPDGFELGDREVLGAQYPDAIADIARYVRQPSA